MGRFSLTQLLLTVALVVAPMGIPVLADDTAGAGSSAQPSTVKADHAPTDGKHSYNEVAIKHYNHGHDLHQQGFLNQAIAEYKAAVAADDHMEEAYTNLGLIYTLQRNYGKAIDAFKKSLALNPDRPNALNGLGTVLYAKNRLNEAMEKWRQAVKIAPNFASAYYNMGNALENEKEYKESVENYVSAMSVAPSMADTYYRIGCIYAKQKHPAQALLLLQKSLQLQPNAEFEHNAKKIVDSIAADLKADASDVPEVKMNIIAPPAGDEAAAVKSGGG